MSLDDLDRELGLLGNPAGSAPVMPASALLEYAPVAAPIITGFAGWQVGVMMAASTMMGLGIGAGGVGTAVYLTSETPVPVIEYVTKEIVREVPVVVDMQGPEGISEAPLVERIFIEGRCEVEPEPAAIAHGTVEEEGEVELSELALAAAEMDPEWLADLFVPDWDQDAERDPPAVVYVDDRYTGGALRVRLGLGSDTAAAESGSKLAALGPRLGAAGVYYFDEERGTPWASAGVGSTLVSQAGGGKLSPSASIAAGYAWVGDSMRAEIGWDVSPRFVPSREIQRQQPRRPAGGRDEGAPQQQTIEPTTTEISSFATVFTGPTIGVGFGQDHNVHIGATARAASIPTPQGSVMVPAVGLMVGVQPRIAKTQKK